MEVRGRAGSKGSAETSGLAETTEPAGQADTSETTEPADQADTSETTEPAGQADTEVHMIKTTIGVQGMACNMCENHVNDAVRNTVKCKKVTSDHKKGITEVISAEPIDEEAVRNAITKDGYEVTSFESAPYEKKGLFGFGR